MEQGELISSVAVKLRGVPEARNKKLALVYVFLFVALFVCFFFALIRFDLFCSVLLVFLCCFALLCFALPPFSLHCIVSFCFGVFIFVRISLLGADVKCA